MANTKRRREKHKRWWKKSPRYRTGRARRRFLRELEAERAEREARMRRAESNYPEEEKPMNKKKDNPKFVLLWILFAMLVVVVTGYLAQSPEWLELVR
jgi:hypothetical protein